MNFAVAVRLEFFFAVLAGDSRGSYHLAVMCLLLSSNVSVRLRGCVKYASGAVEVQISMETV